MKTIEVSAALIVNDNKMLIAKRSGGEFDDMWEFPGGKIEPNETKEETVIREIKEELDLDITVSSHLISIQYAYPTFNLEMHVYICKIISGELVLNEHADFAWTTQDEIDNFNWIPADIEVVEAIKALNTL